MAFKRIWKKAHICERGWDSFGSLQFIKLDVNGNTSAASKACKFIGFINGFKNMSSLPLLWLALSNMFLRLFSPWNSLGRGCVTYRGPLVTPGRIILLWGLWQPHRLDKATPQTQVTAQMTSAWHPSLEVPHAAGHCLSPLRSIVPGGSQGKEHFPGQRRPRHIGHAVPPPRDVTSLGSSDLCNGGWRDDWWGSQLLWGVGLRTGLMFPNFKTPLCFVLFKGMWLSMN